MSKGYYVSAGDYVGSQKSWITRETYEASNLFSALDKAYVYLLKYGSVEVRKIK